VPARGRYETDSDLVGKNVPAELDEKVWS
jgi:hypothetical protein